MNEDFEFTWWQKVANKLGLGGVLAIFGIISCILSCSVIAAVFYFAVKFIVAH